MKRYRPCLGDQRIIRKFLFFPKRELGLFRWLEQAEWLEVYSKYESENDANIFYYWGFEEWLDVPASEIPEYNDE